MKWAILSDVHGNLEALHAVIADLRRESADRIAFLGDAVGYGANPNECLLLLRELTEWMVAGNHDYGAAGLTDISYFNPAAKAAILWTEKKLSAEGRAYLRGLPLLSQVVGITFVHATPHAPGEWNYIFTFPEAEEAFRALVGELAFIGHSHSPLILAKRGDEKVTLYEKEEATLEKGIRYIINVGSVGQPRDGNPKAAYGLYDEAGRKYLLKRVPYDMPTAQKKIISAGLPRSLAQRLSEGT
ncbi:MAG: metallophosphoesterase family protein [Thermodesulfobacteriota bacterium]|jgi:diadenosine tetraphosphatase ApaH/serine/threonine PP2A family protein phosphatase